MFISHMWYGITGSFKLRIYVFVGYRERLRETLGEYTIVLTNWHLRQQSLSAGLPLAPLTHSLTNKLTGAENKKTTNYQEDAAPTLRACSNQKHQYETRVDVTVSRLI